MIFANGDCHITYQQQEPLSPARREDLEQSFKDSSHVYLLDMVATGNTLTFYYSPIRVMEEHNTIEPGDVVIEEVREFLTGMEFSV
ncbi:hypothetical protein J4760_09230 [Salinicoccus sp. ID82-1]|uniref:hypothetical protein n=1 Tax=Salinicoccus sp. ID82-1 TaxID=2820269 RepID=UPI001F1CF766|nr:hypothetical protein [Salinicoccus sp. ID82-1]MCG1010203.1 hypothetical protein [Salinicoccus sp. ID82-1]